MRDVIRAGGALLAASVLVTGCSNPPLSQSSPAPSSIEVPSSELASNTSPSDATTPAIVAPLNPTLSARTLAPSLASRVVLRYDGTSLPRLEGATEALLASIVSSAGLTSCTITNTARTASQQGASDVRSTTSERTRSRRPTDSMEALATR